MVTGNESGPEVCVVRTMCCSDVVLLCNKDNEDQLHAMLDATSLHYCCNLLVYIILCDHLGTLDICITWMFLMMDEVRIADNN